MPMEQLPINNNGGQGYGFILYQTELAQFPNEIVIEQVFDRAQVLIVTFISTTCLVKQPGAQVTCIENGNNSHKHTVVWFNFLVPQANLNL